MNSGPFWLASINSESLSIAYVTYEHNYRISAIGPEVEFTPEPSSFTKAVDQSLSSSADSAGLDSSQEPDSIALILPPSWIGNDGKILSDKLKLFEEMFRQLKLRPMGFISYDDAIAETNNQIEGYLSSFVLVNFVSTQMQVSLIYLGKVIERVEKEIIGEFGSVLLENALLELNTKSTLPPQIIVTGSYTDSILSSIKAHPWVGRRDVETFLHFPDIKSYTQTELTGVYLQAVASQFDTTTVSSPPAEEKHSEPELVDQQEEVSDISDDEADFEPDDNLVDPEETIESSSSKLIEVDPDDIGFSEVDDNFTVPTSLSHEELIDESVGGVEVVSPPVINPKRKFTLPKIKFKLPHLSLPTISARWMLFPLVISPLLILFPFFYSKAEVTLFLTPYNFQKTVTAVFDPNTESVDTQKGIFPVVAQVKELTTSSTVATSGQKTIGDRSTGEIVVYNKQDKPLNLSKGSILTDQAGHKFELETAIQIPSSRSNFSLGVINLGQTKAMIRATDIGPEYNLEKDAMLSFKEVGESSAVAKVNTTLSGGSRRQIRAVSASDKAQLDTQMTTAINETASKNTQVTSAKAVDIIPELTQTKKGRVEYSREVGEEADELSATMTTTVTTYHLTEPQKNKIVTALFSADPDFSNVVSNFSEFKLSIVNKNQATFAVKFLPKVDKSSVAKMVAGKSQSQAVSNIKKNVRRVYNYQITTNLKPLTIINPLPFRLENIIINTK
jgi:hypothetical protein